MAVYTVPNGDAVDFQLAAFTPPQGDQVNFELLESVGTQIVVWDTISIDDTNFSADFEYTFKVIDVHDDISIEEYYASLFTELNISIYDILGAVEESETVNLDVLVPDVSDSVNVNEVLSDIGLTLLYIDVFESVSITEDVDWIICHLMAVDEDLIVVEDAELLDLVVEVFTPFELVQILEDFQTWTDWHNLWSAYEDILIQDFPIIGRDPTDIDLKVENIPITEFAGIAPWAYFVDTYEEVTTEDVLERLLVGHFPYPLDIISVEDVIDYIEVFPPYPFPKQYVFIQEYWTHEMVPPSLSWIAEYPVIVEYLVVGQDPHYADLGFQDITIQEVPILSPNPLYVDVQDVGDIVPFIRDFGWVDVGYPVNVSETLVTIDELTAFFLSQLIPNVHDQVGHLEVVYFSWITLGVWSPVENIPVQESLTIALDQILLSVYEPITVQDVFSESFVGQEINVYDEVGYPVEEFVYVLDLVIELHPYEEMLMAYDVAFVTFADVFAEVYDTISIEESTDFFVGQEISVFDQTTVSESVLHGVTPIPLYVIEDVYVSEYVDRTGVPQIVAWDFIEINEFLSISRDVLYAAVDDSITAIESFEGIIALPFDVYDDLQITESFSSFLSVWNLYAFSEVAVTEEVYIVGGRSVSVLDEVSVEEFLYVLPLYYGLSVSDLVSVSEWADIQDLLYFISRYDSVSVVESAVLSGLIWYIDAFDSLTLQDVAEVQSAWEIDVFEAIGVLESLYIQPLYHQIGVSDQITADEWAYLEGLLWHISVFDGVSVEELGYVEGIVPLFIFDEIAVLEWAKLEGLLWHLYAEENISVEDVDFVLLPTIKVQEDISVQDWLYIVLPSFSVYEEIDLTDIGIVTQQYIYMPLVSELISVVEESDAVTAWVISVDDDIGVAEVYVNLFFLFVLVQVEDYIFLQEWIDTSDLTWYINVADQIVASEYWQGSGLSQDLLAIEELTIYEFATIYTDLLYVFPDELTYVIEYIDIIRISQVDVYDDLTITDVIIPIFVFLADVFDSITAVEHLWVGITPLPMEHQETISVDDVLSIVIPESFISVYESLSHTEGVGLSIDIHYYREVFEALSVQEWISLYFFHSMYAFTEATISEWAFTQPDRLLLEADDSITITEDLTAKHILLVDVFDQLSIIEIFNLYDGVYLVALFEDIQAVEAVDLETTGIAVYPHESIFKVEWVEAYLDVLNLAVFSTVSVGEDISFVGARTIDWIQIQESVSLNIPFVAFEVYDELGVISEWVQVFTSSADALAIFSYETLYAETWWANARLDQLWTGIQVDFITAEDVFVDSLVGFLIEAVESVSISEYIDAGIGFLVISESENIGIFDTAGAWFFFADIIQGFEPLFVEENLQILMPLLLIDESETISVTEFADRIEGVNLELYELAFSIFDVVDVVIEALVPDEFDEIGVSESVYLWGLALRFEVSDSVDIRSDNYDAGTPFSPNWQYLADLEIVGTEIDVFESFPITEFIQVYSYVVFVVSKFEEINVSESASLSVEPQRWIIVNDGLRWSYSGKYYYTKIYEDVWLSLDPQGFVAVDFMKAIEEYVKLDIAPIEMSAFEVVLVNEWEEVNVDIYRYMWEYHYVEEAIEMLLFPPFPFIFDSVTVSEYIATEYEPWEFGVHSEVQYISDWATAYVISGPLSIGEDVSVSEYIDVRITHYAWWLGVADNILVQEVFAWGLDPIPNAVADLINVVELVTLTDLVIELFGDDTITTQESPVLSLTRLYVEKFDSLAITEQGLLGVELKVVGADALSVFDWVDAVLNILNIFTYDSAYVEELSELYTQISLSTFDLASVVESVDIDLSLIDVQVADDVSLIEYRQLRQLIDISISDEIGIILAISVSVTELFTQIVDQAVLSEWVEIGASPLISVFDSVGIAELVDTTKQPQILEIEAVTVTEAVTVRLPELAVLVENEVIGQESIQILLPQLITDTISVVSISDYGAVSLTWLGAIIGEEVGIADVAEWLIPWLPVEVLDSIGQVESASVYLGLSYSAVDVAGVQDEADLFTDVLVPFIWDPVSVQEWTAFVHVHQIFASTIASISEAVSSDFWTHTFLLDGYESITIQDANYQYLPIHTELVFDEITIGEATFWFSRLFVDIFDESIAVESAGLTIRELLFSGQDLVTVEDWCYTHYSYVLDIYEDVDVEEWFIWGLSVQFISVAEAIGVDELRGIEVEQYVLYPIIFGAKFRG